jgi:hypothetical protein
MKSLRRDNSPKQYVGQTVADVEYTKLRLQGLDAKSAAKMAQERTGISLISGKRMTTKGFQ